MVTKDQLVQEIEKNNSHTDLVMKALKQAEASHNGQKRDDGTSPLDNHVYPVAYSILKRYQGFDKLEDLLILAILHDTMEDDPNFTEKVCVQNFGEEICKNVVKLTKDKYLLKNYSGDDKILYELLKYFCNKEYIKDIKKASEVCKIVKLEDRLNNLNSIENIGSNVKNLRYVIETDTLFKVMARETKSFDYVPLLKNEIDRLCPTLSSLRVKN